MTSPAPLTPDGAPWPPRAGAPASYVPMYGPEFEDDPTAFYRGLREKYGPVVPVEVDERGGFRGWLVLGHREQLEVLNNRSGLFTHDSRWWRDQAEGRVPDHPLVQQTERRRNMFSTDGTEHQRLRSPIDQALAGLHPEHTHGYVDHLADQLIDAFPAFGPVDVVAWYAQPLPMLVMMGLLGMPEERATAVSQTVLEIVQAGPGATAAARRMDELMREQVEEKLKAPGADLTSWLIAQYGTGVFDPDEVADQVRLLLQGGLGPTSAWIAATLLRLVTDDRLRGDVEKGVVTLPEAANRVLWDDPPVHNVFMNWATAPTALGQYEIGAGDLVIVSMAASGTDPAVRPVDEDALRVSRAHLAWGAGAHACPAQDLGSMIVEAAVRRLLHRLPTLRLAIDERDLTWGPSYVVRMPIELPLMSPTRVPASGAAEPPAFMTFPAAPGAPQAVPPIGLPAGAPGADDPARGQPRWRALSTWFLRK
ncbi:cytochrome P450 family protein [Streptomyces mayteni]